MKEYSNEVENESNQIEKFNKVNKAEHGSSNHKKESKIIELSIPFQLKRKKELKSHLIQIVDSILLSPDDDDNIIVSYQRLKREESPNVEMAEKNILILFENVQKGAKTLASNFLTLQYISEESIKIEKQIECFLEGFDSKKYGKNIIASFLKDHHSGKLEKKTTSEIIESFKEKNPDLKDIARGTFDNWTERFKKYRSH